MDDKTITTFETTITWFFTSDILPEHEDKILVAFFDGDIADCEFLNENGTVKFLRDGREMNPDAITRWCYLPTLD